MMDSVIGIDVHMVAPIPGIPIHPYCGSLYLWTTPQFPTFSSGVVLINGMPACTVGFYGNQLPLRAGHSDRADAD